VLGDEEMAVLAKTDNPAMEYLLDKFKNLVHLRAKNYFILGADRDDIVQEGMIGLYKAVRDFKPEKLSSFCTFAELCITRQIITGVKTATRQKHLPLNQYVSLDKPVNDEGTDRTLLETIASQRESDPEKVIVAQEVSDDIRERLRRNLSEFEAQTFESYLGGRSYREIARYLDCPLKSVDNALQRIKRKMEKNLADLEFR
jgi:RNA polymerase sporulation-specific sigma factor